MCASKKFVQLLSFFHLLRFIYDVVCSKKKEDGSDVTEPVLEDDNLSRQQEAADGNVEAQSQRYISGLFFVGVRPSQKQKKDANL